MISALGWKLVVRDPRRTLVAVCGIAVAVLIVFVEMGFLNGVIDSHLRIVQAMRGEIVVLDRRRTNLNRWDGMLAIRAGQIAAIEGVASVFPVYQSADDFRGGAAESEHRINVVAFAPDHPALELAWSRSTLELLRRPGTVLLDRLSRPIYGALEPGQDVWLEGRRLTLGGFVELGPTMVADGLLVMSEGTFRSLKPSATPRMAVVALAPGADPEGAKTRIA